MAKIKKIVCCAVMSYFDDGLIEVVVTFLSSMFFAVLFICRQHEVVLTRYQVRMIPTSLPGHLNLREPSNQLNRSLLDTNVFGNKNFFWHRKNRRGQKVKQLILGWCSSLDFCACSYMFIYFRTCSYICSYVHTFPRMFVYRVCDMFWYMFLHVRICSCTFLCVLIFSYMFLCFLICPICF